MPRKKSTQAEAETRQAYEVRLRYLSRNPEFRRAIDSLIQLRDALPGQAGELTPERFTSLRQFVATLDQVARKWDVLCDLLSVLAWRGWYKTGTPQERIPAASVLFDSPVIAWNTPSPLLGILPAQPTPEDSRYLNFRVDLAYPVDTLLSVIEKELRRFAKERLRGRRRLDKTDFYLKAFDLAESGETFKAIAVKLKRPISTVKSAYLAASRNIFGPKPRPLKKALPLAAFDAADHCQKCPTCQKAQTPKEFCRKALLYANQGQKGQRERLGHDRVSERAPAKSATYEGPESVDV